MATTMLAAVLLRARALSHDLENLAATRGLRDPARAIAAAQVKSLVDAIAAQAIKDDERTTDESNAIVRLRPLLRYLTFINDYADLLFGRDRPAPVSLSRAVQRELGKLGNSDLTPLITVGGPGNFETDPVELWPTLHDPDLLPDLEAPEEHVHVFSVPATEGARALWTPIAVGHEVAHIARTTRDLVDQLPLQEWLEQAGASTWEEEDASAGDDTISWFRTDELLDVLRNWSREVLCDLYAVRRFGPAAIAAQCDFLASVSADQAEPRGSHPPPALRVEMMLAALPTNAEAFDVLTRSWSAWAQSDTSGAESRAVSGLVEIVRAHSDDFVKALSPLKPKAYDAAGREDVVLELVSWLLENLPGSERAAGRRVKRADILNAGWVATRVLLEDPDDRATLPARLGAVDDLVSKALDNADFCRLWRNGGGAADKGASAHAELDRMSSTAPASESSPNAAVGDTDQGSESSNDAVSEATDEVPVVGGVLTEAEIRRRLQLGADVKEVANADSQAIVALPRTGLVVSGATMDVRLGREFITFKRTSTESFSAASADQEPREMQELEEKDWGGSFVLHPGQLVLASTLEYLRLPGDLTAQVITRSSYGRLGLLSATAVQVQPRFVGCLTLELANLGQMPLTLVPGERIAQLVFSLAAPATRDVPSKYAFPTGPQFSRVREDPDLRVLRSMRP